MDPPPLAPRRRIGRLGEARARRPRPRVRRRPPAARPSRTAKAVPSGVCANTLPSSASTQRARSAAAHRDGQRSGGDVERDVRGPVSSASTDQNATRSADHLGGVARRPRRSRRPPGLVDERGDRPLHRVHAGGDPVASSASRRASASSRSAVSGVRSRWDRSATVSRSCAQQLADPAGQVVQRAGHLARPRAGRRGRPGRPGRRRPAGATRPASVGDRPDQRAGEPVGDQQR